MGPIVKVVLVAVAEATVKVLFNELKKKLR